MFVTIKAYDMIEAHIVIIFLIITSLIYCVVEVLDTQISNHINFCTLALQVDLILCSFFLPKVQYILQSSSLYKQKKNV